MSQKQHINRKYPIHISFYNHFRCHRAIEGLIHVIFGMTEWELGSVYFFLFVPVRNRPDGNVNRSQ